MERNLLKLSVLRKLILLSVILPGYLFCMGQSDLTRPYVVDVTPDNLSISLDAGTTISATFNEAMNASTVNSSTFEIRTLLTNQLVPATIVYNASARRAILYPSQGLTSGLLYVARVKGGSSGVKDLAGNTMASDYIWYFMVIPLFDFTPPIVLSTNPANAATGVSTSITPTAFFSEEMRTSSITTSTVEIRNSANTLIPSTVSYNNSTRTMSIDPTSTLAANTLYRVTIKGGSSGVKDNAGNALSSNYSWTFTTLAPDVTRPTVTAVTPANGSTNVSNSTTVTATFSEAMNASTITTTNVELRNNVTSALITASVSYNASTRVATLTPTAALAYNTVYRATVKGGTTGVKDLAGNALLSNYTWTFTTANPDITRPTVTSVSPANASTNISITTTVNATFSEAMNPATITNATVELRNNVTNALISASVAYNTTTRTATLTPAAALAYNTVYRATIISGSAGVKDLAGNALLSNYVWTFRTVVGDVTPPTITSVSPLDDATDVNVATTVSAVFSENMMASSITTATVQLAAGANLVNASVTYNATTRTVTLTPSAPLQSTTLYTATIKSGASGVKDLVGNAMAADYSWSFTTADVTPPTVVNINPANSATNIIVSTTVTVEFSEAMNETTINSSTVELRKSTGELVDGTLVYDAGANTLTFIPSLALAYSSNYTLTINIGGQVVRDVAGNDMPDTFTSSFSTLAPPNSNVFTVFDPTVMPDHPAHVDNPVEVGMRFRSSINGYITGLRFYKGVGNIGTHTGHLWTNTGTMLGEVVFVGETASGWQEVQFATPIAITANTTYVASYHSSAGIYAYTNNYFTTSVVNGPLTALANGIDGPNGVYRYSTTSVFPNQTFASTNYFVDVAFTESVGPDTNPPTVVDVDPNNNATNVPVAATVSAVFNEMVDPVTVNSSTVELKDASNTTVPGTVNYHAANKTVVFTPSLGLAHSTSYSLTIKGGAQGVEDLSGNHMVNNFTSVFTTAAPPNDDVISVFGPTVMPVHPAHVDQPVEVGMRFRSSLSGYITGLRFYKGVGNVGTHTGHLWTNNGTMLGEVVFVQETASGWQQVMFSTPIPITAGTHYVASYHSSAGIYAYTNNYFNNPVVNGPLTAVATGDGGPNGVYRYSTSSIFPNQTYAATNYFVDVLFSEVAGPDNTAPSIVSVSPASSTIGVPLNASISAVFDEELDPATINSSTVELVDDSNVPVAGTVSYNASTNTVTLTPSSNLALASGYTARIKGDVVGVKDVAGNPLATDYTWQFITANEPPLVPPTEGAGGPILVVSTNTNPFSRYTAEILRAEGLNEFAVSDISAISESMLNAYDVIVLGEMTVTQAQVNLLTNWVTNGGVLIAFKPSALLYPLCGISAPSGVLSDKYLLVNTASGPGTGIVNQTIQYHGNASLHSITGGSGTVSLATLYSSASAATTNPAITQRTVASAGGKVITFTYDLPRSIVYTRQGNPSWAGQKRDGQAGPIRSDDMFFGGSSADWIDFNKVAIPQADEQQRLLANIIIRGSLHRKPLPRFWYLPKNMKAAIVMTGDDHATGGTVARFNQYINLLPANNSPQDVADWKAIRGTSYVYPTTPIDPAQATAYDEMGFELALHPTTGCNNYTPSSIQTTLSTQLAQFGSAWPGVPAPVSNRTHCLAWSDWASQARAEQQNGIRFDVTYYYWPEVWMQNRPGMFTGSGMPMRFADLDGTMIDVYQAATQMTDETNMNYTAFCNAVLDKATGPEGYYGVFTTNMHTDNALSAGSDAIIASALAHNVSVVSAKQMLTWIDGRNNSSFGNMEWNNDQLSFTITARSGARNLKTMLPLYSDDGQLVSVTRDGNAISFTVEMIKGIQYAFFDAASGVHEYVATYGFAARTTNNNSTDEQPAVTEGAAATTEKASPEAVVTDGTLYAKVMPNPSTAYFNIVINSYNAAPVTVRVVDITGRVIETHQKVASTGILRLGHNWSAGNYFAEVIQGDQRKVIKMIKTN